MAPRNRKTSRRVSPMGVTLRRMRERAGLEQSELAERAGVHRLTVVRLETGAVSWVQPDSGDRLAAALGITRAELEAGDPQVADTAKLVQDYERSPWFAVDSPTDTEMAWLRGLPGVVWLGMKPTAKTIHLMVEALRSGRERA